MISLLNWKPPDYKEEVGLVFRLAENGVPSVIRISRLATWFLMPMRVSRGTFKDREIIMRRPDKVLEGLAIAALAVGAKEVYCYLRGEF